MERFSIPKDYVPLPDSGHLLYQVQLPAFEGPLDLLLFLIRRHALDIFDIPMAFVCERYIEYLSRMEDLNIDIAAEFMLMASELVYIKSKMLLPKPEKEAEEEIDPRAQLVERLLLHQVFKQAAEQLEDRDKLDDEVFGRKPERLPKADGQAPMQEVGVYSLVKAFSAVLKRQRPEVRHQVLMETVSLAERLQQVIARLGMQETTTLAELLAPYLSQRIEVIVTFLALLELTRMQLLRLYQQDEGELYIRVRFASEKEAIEHLENMQIENYAG
jgi:segregation and condensation protein A